MGMRITTNMTMSTYRYNLMQSTNRWANAQNKVLTHRNFNSYAEDPAAATHVWRIRRSITETGTHYDNNNDTLARFRIAYSAMEGIKTGIADKIAKASSITGNSDTTASARQELAGVIRNAADSVIQSINGAKLGDHFVFAGKDALNVPFSWSEDGKTLYYRGVNVAAGSVEQPAGTAPTWGAVDVDEYGVPAAAKDPAQLANMTANEKAWAAYYKDQGDVARLKAMSEEETNSDIGLGLQEADDGSIINGSTFNMALPGINMLGGYGLDADGDPKNLALLMKKYADVLERSNPETGQWNKEDKAEANRLLNKITKNNDEIISAFASDISGEVEFLETNKDRLKDQHDALNVELANLEDVDPADAITEFLYNYTCYNAALKVGTQLLSQSLIDYMN